MKKWKGILAVAGLAAALTLGVACTNGEAASAPAPVAPAPAPSAPITAPAQPAIAPAVPSSEARTNSGMVAVGAPSVSGMASLQSYGSSQTGIWVSGQGKMAVEPDLVLLNVGVESRGATVAEANSKASTAMDAIVNALKARGLEDADIQTRSFNIFPQYEYREIVESGIRRGEQILVGYQVNNSATIKIRDMDSVGEIIDEVANAGGDATRINGINFTVEDPKPMMTALREQAVADAMAKAQQFADLTGVGLGRLVFISEGGATQPIVQSFDSARMAFAEGAALAPSTSISGGELELSLNVQAVFAIQ